MQMLIMHRLHCLISDVKTLKLETNYHNSMRYKQRNDYFYPSAKLTQTESVIAMNWEYFEYHLHIV